MSDALARAADAESRRLAQQEFQRPLAIEAGAGTGKTATLVARVLAWCLGPGWERARTERPDASAEQLAERVLRGVVAITFTEAAAAEMEQRIDAALAQLAAGATPAGFDAADPPGERVEALRRALDQLVVQTIHAYCRRLLASFPLEAGLHPLFEIDADGTATAAAVRETVASQLAAAYARGDDSVLELAERGIGPRELEEELIAQLGAGVRAEELARDPLAPERIAAFQARLRAAHDAVDAAIGERLEGIGKGKARAAADALRGARRALASPVRDRNELQTLCDALAELWEGSATNAILDWGKDKWTQGEASALGESCEALRAAALRLGPLLQHLAKLDLDGLARLAPLLAKLCADVEERLRRSGRIGFEGLLERSAALLEEHPEVAATLRRGIDQLLVDEFQDTDPRQCALVAALALEGPPGERPGLFVVGDPKQSIYGWRHADLAAYEGLLAGLVAAGGQVAPLCVNHRSVPAVLDEVTRVIEPVMQREEGLQPAFEALVPCPNLAESAGFSAGGRAAVELWVAAQADSAGTLVTTRSSEAAQLEARALARELRELHDVHQVRWGQVGLLFRSRGEWDVYLGALREQQIPFRVEGDRTYYRRREILDAAALVSCVLDPNDQIALVTLLRSSAAGVPDAAWIPLWAGGLPDLAARLGHAGEAAADAKALLARVAAELPAGLPGLADLAGWADAAALCLDAVAELRRSFARDPGDVFVERLRASLCFEAAEAARFLGSWRAANLERFFRDLTADLARATPESAPASLLRRLRHAVAEEETPSSEPAGPASEDAVSVVTLHGAKGLAWDHVYLMQLHKGESKVAAPGEVGRIDGALEASWCRCPTLGHDQVAQRRARVADAERVRTLYVGMTRARQRLVLSGTWPDFQSRGGDSHVHLLERRVPAAPDLAALAREAEAGRADAAETRWVFPALVPDTEVAGSRSAQASAAPDDPRAAPGPSAPRAHESVADPGARTRRRLGISVSALAAEGDAPDATERHDGDALDAAEGRDGEELGVGSRGGAGSLGARVGTLVHAALERLDLAAEPETEWPRQRGWLAARVAREEFAPESDRLRAEVFACWDALGAGPLVPRLWALAERVVARELPLLLPAPAGGARPEDGSGATPGACFVSGAIDLLYCDERGRLVVVDYKSDAAEPGPEAATRRAHYARQGALYCRAVAEALRPAEPPRFEIWWLRRGEVESFDAPAPRDAAQLSLALGAPSR